MKRTHLQGRSRDKKRNTVAAQDNILLCILRIDCKAADNGTVLLVVDLTHLDKYTETSVHFAILDPYENFHVSVLVYCFQSNGIGNIPGAHQAQSKPSQDHSVMLVLRHEAVPR